MREKKRERIQIPYTIYGFFLTPFLTCQITVGIWQTLKRLASPNGQQCTPSFHPFNFIVLNLDPLVWPPRTAWQRPVLSLHLACWRAAPDMPQDLVMVFVLRKVFKMTLYRCTISLGVCTGEEIKKKIHTSQKHIAAQNTIPDNCTSTLWTWLVSNNSHKCMHLFYNV